MAPSKVKIFFSAIMEFFVCFTISFWPTWTVEEYLNDPEINN